MESTASSSFPSADLPSAGFVCSVAELPRVGASCEIEATLDAAGNELVVDSPLGECAGALEACTFVAAAAASCRGAGWAGGTLARGRVRVAEGLGGSALVRAPTRTLGVAPSGASAPAVGAASCVAGAPALGVTLGNAGAALGDPVPDREAVSGR